MAVSTIALSGCLGGGDFTYGGDPVDPRCFLYGQESGSVALAGCTGETIRNADYPAATDKPVNDPDRGIGYDFRSDEDGAPRGFVYYKVIGKMDDQYVVLINQSGGGTGQFSSLRRVRLDGDVMRTEALIAGGDRCNGGVASASMQAANISYSQMLTPFDLIELSGGNRETRFVAYDDIAACASCCVAQANYTNGELTGVTLTMEPAEVPTDQEPKDTCFYNSYSAAYKQLGVSLDTGKLAEFGRKFGERCAPLGNHR